MRHAGRGHRVSVLVQELALQTLVNDLESRMVEGDAVVVGEAD